MSDSPLSTESTESSINHGDTGPVRSIEACFAEAIREILGEPSEVPLPASVLMNAMLEASLRMTGEEKGVIATPMQVDLINVIMTQHLDKILNDIQITGDKGTFYRMFSELKETFNRNDEDYFL